MPRTVSRMGASRSAPAPGTSQGTPGGRAQATGARPGKRTVFLGEEVYLWILVLIEVLLISWLRATFGRYHGG